MIPGIAGIGKPQGDADYAAAKATSDAMMKLVEAMAAAHAAAGGKAGGGSKAPTTAAQAPAGPAQWLVQVQAPKVTVNVPPGTDADLAKRAGDGAAKGTKESFNLPATLAATTSG